MPSTETMLAEAVEKLQKVQKEQFEKLEPAILEKLEKGKPFADLAEQGEKASANATKAVDEVNKLAQQLTEEKKALMERLDEFETKFGNVDWRGGARSKGLGAEYLEKRFPNGEADHQAAHDKQRAEAIVVKGAGEAWMLKQNMISGATGSGEALQDSLRLPGVIVQPEDSLVVQSAIPRTFISNRTIDYVRELLFTNNTATVAESTDLSSPVNKPSGNITFELKTATMTTIAQWIPASRQILLFSNRTQLQSYIDRRLRDKVLSELEDQVLLGDGTGTDMEGLVTVATSYNRGYANIQSAAPTQLDTLRRSVTQLQLANYSTDRFILNPADWEAIALLKDTQLRYVLSDPAFSTTPRVWGIPVSPSNRMTEGKFLSGALAQVSELFIGSDVTVEISREHASFFIQNMVAILAEMIATLAVYRPEGLIFGGLTNASS